MTQWHFIIRNAAGDYWSNGLGWSEYREHARHYCNTVPRLPMEGRWVQVPNREAFRYALKELRQDNNGDSWGWAVSWLFYLCDYVTLERELRVPAALHYRPGAFGPYVCDDDVKKAVMDSFTDEQLMYCINALGRYTELLRKHGRSY
jgi:hypothetical protein